MKKLLPQFLLLLTLAGCHLPGTYNKTVTLSMTSKPIINNSVLVPKINGKAYSKIMVIPPSGTIRGEYSPLLTTFEREFLKRGVTVVTPASTGKIAVKDDGGVWKDEAGLPLSDLERVLLMAEKAGVEAVLQIGAFAWSEKMNPTRFFILPSGAGRERSFNEVAEDVFIVHPEGDRFQYSANKLVFAGRLIDISGELVATLDMVLPANHVLPREYHAKFAPAPLQDGWETIGQNYPYFSAFWVAKAQTLAEEQVVEAVVNVLAPRNRK